MACDCSFSLLFVGQVEGLQMNPQDADSMIRSDESCAQPIGDATNEDTSDRVCSLLACCMSACSIGRGPAVTAARESTLSRPESVDSRARATWGPGPDARLTCPWTSSKSKFARTAALSG